MTSKEKKINLSVALATYNEEEQLSACLDSVRGWVDEVVIVDGSSRDKTREIGEKYGARVIKTKNRPIFHINKQMAIDRCRGNWILQLDADERVDEKLKGEILEIVKKGSEFCAFYLPRKNYLLGRWLRKTGQYPNPVIRFFKRGRARLPCKSVHEQMEVEGETGWLKGHLLHYGSLTFAHYLKRENRYSSLEAVKMVKEGEKVTAFNFFKYVLWLPFKTWFLLFFRHKGFIDGFPGFVFSLFSGFHFMFAYIKFWELVKTGGKTIDATRWE